jgi:hypothetical protein
VSKASKGVFHNLPILILEAQMSQKPRRYESGSVLAFEVTFSLMFFFVKCNLMSKLQGSHFSPGIRATLKEIPKLKTYLK